MTFVALLRAINLGRVNRVPMGDLRVSLTDAGFTDVVTHLQSGNVVLGSAKRPPAAVANAVERLVEIEFGVDTDVVVRTAGEPTRSIISAVVSDISNSFRGETRPTSQNRDVGNPCSY